MDRIEVVELWESRPDSHALHLLKEAVAYQGPRDIPDDYMDADGVAYRTTAVHIEVRSDQVMVHKVIMRRLAE